MISTLSMLPDFVDGCEQMTGDMSGVEMALVPLSSRCGPAEQAWWAQLAGARGVLLFGESSKAPSRAADAESLRRLALRERMYEKQVAIPVYQLEDALGTSLFGQVLASFGRDSRGLPLDENPEGGARSPPLLRPILDLSVRVAVDLGKRAPRSDLGASSNDSSSSPHVPLVWAPVVDLWLASWRPGDGMEPTRHAIEAVAGVSSWAESLERSGRLRVRVHPPLRAARHSDAADSAACIRDGRYCLMSGGDALAEAAQTGVVEPAQEKEGSTSAQISGKKTTRSSKRPSHRFSSHATATATPPSSSSSASASSSVHPALSELSMREAITQDLLVTCARKSFENAGRPHEWWSYLSRFVKRCVRPLPIDDHDVATRQARLDERSGGAKVGTRSGSAPLAPSSSAASRGEGSPLSDPVRSVKDFGNSECALCLAFDMKLDLNELKRCAGDLTKLERDLPLPVVDDDLVVPPLGGLSAPIAAEPLPGVFVNGKQHGGRLETTTLKAQVCAEYREGAEPAACLESALELDECATNLDPCWRSPYGDGVTACVDTFRGYVCKCPVGYRGNGRDCEDVDECAVGLDYGTPRVDLVERDVEDARADDLDVAIPSHGCSQRCVNAVGGYRCACRSGYRLVAGSDGGPPGTCELDVPETAKLTVVGITAAIVAFAIAYTALRVRRATLLGDYGSLAGPGAGGAPGSPGGLSAPLDGPASQSAVAAFAKRLAAYGIAPTGAAGLYGLSGYGMAAPPQQQRQQQQVAMSSFYEPIEDVDAEVGRRRRWMRWQMRRDEPRDEEAARAGPSPEAAEGEREGRRPGAASPSGSRTSSLEVSSASPGASTPGEASDAEEGSRNKLEGGRGKGPKDGKHCASVGSSPPLPIAASLPSGPAFPSAGENVPPPPFWASVAKPIALPRRLTSEPSCASSIDVSTPSSSLSRSSFLLLKGSRSSLLTASSDWSEASIDVAKAAAREDPKHGHGGVLPSGTPPSPPPEDEDSA